MIFLLTVGALVLACAFAHRAIMRARYLGAKDAMSSFALALLCAALTFAGVELLLDPTAFLWKWLPSPCSSAMGALC
jgi:hypothetical protein